jgi:hypothetical protein
MKLKIAEKAIIVNVAKKKFFELSEEFGDIPSFRRILSLLRLENKCKTIIIFKHNIDVIKGGLCSNRNDKSRRCESCEDYINYMKDDSTEYELLEKLCAKMYFFSSRIRSEQEIDSTKHQKNILGYSIIHIDKLRLRNDKNSKPKTRSYVPECVLSNLSHSIRGFKYGNFNSEININGEKFQISNGNYFSQQNGITNCCAHASIKTTLRGYDQDISCSNINQSLINYLNIKEDKATSIIRRFARGLKPNEMLAAIRNLSKNRKNIKRLDPFLITAHDLPVSLFVETIYRAIESKIPVILLLRIPENISVGHSFQGHTISIVGHTFNRHNWCAYGSGYFSAINKEKYLSSYLWCDNYVVQDDNFGPAYQLPCNFLSDYYEYGVTIEKLSLNIASQKELSNSRPTYPLAAIIIPPAEMKGIKENIYHVENVAVDKFVHEIHQFARLKKFEHTDQEKIFFDRYFYYIFKYQDVKPKLFIARTVLVEKSEYLNRNTEIYDIYSKHIEKDNDFTLLDVVSEVLPNYFWITEISVPELYWVNNAKIGEIITDPAKDLNVKLIRLPYFLAIYPEGDNEYYTFHLKQKDNHHSLLKKYYGMARNHN